MTKLKTVGIVIVVLGVLLVVGGLAFGSPFDLSRAQAQEKGAPTATVTRGGIEETVSATGTVATTQQASLAFAMSGRVVEVLVSEGQQVTAGQVLARVDSSDLDQQIAGAAAALATAQVRLAQAKLPASAAEVAQAEARLMQAMRPASEAELAAAQAGLDAAQAQLDKLLAPPTAYDLRAAQLQVDSAKNNLWGYQGKRDAIAGDHRQSGGAKDQAEAQVLVAEVSVDQALLAQQELLAPPRAEDVAAAEAQVDKAQAQLAQLLERPRAEDVALAQGQLDKLVERPRAEDVALAQAQVDEAALALSQAQESRNHSLLMAPFDGTLLEVLAAAGEWASPGAPAIVLADTDDAIIEVMLDEIDIGKIAVGQPVRLGLKAFPGEELDGSVAEIAPAATQTSGGVAYRVEIVFDSGELSVKQGMTTDVDIVNNAQSDVLLVSNRAMIVDRSAGRYYLDLQGVDGAAQRIEVEIGLRDDNYTQIVSGAEVGDVVILATVQTQTDEGGGLEMPNGGLLKMMGGAR